MHDTALAREPEITDKLVAAHVRKPDGYHLIHHRLGMVRARLGPAG